MSQLKPVCISINFIFNTTCLCGCQSRKSYIISYHVMSYIIISYIISYIKSYHILINCLSQTAQNAASANTVFRRVRKISKIDFQRPYICLSVRKEKLGSYGTDFRKILYLSSFRKSVERIRVSLKSDKNNGYFT